MTDELKCPPCCGCAYCCKKVPCSLAYAVYDEMRHVQGLDCPALYYKDGRWWCKLYDPVRFPWLFGYGCSSSLFNTVREAQLEKMRKKDAAP